MICGDLPKQPDFCKINPTIGVNHLKISKIIPKMRTRIKICCTSSNHEAQTAIRVGADALGLVGQMLSGPGIIGDALATGG